jgi:hypothetical protein
MRILRGRSDTISLPRSPRLHTFHRASHRAIHRAIHPASHPASHLAIHRAIHPASHPASHLAGEGVGSARSRSIIRETGTPKHHDAELRNESEHNIGPHHSSAGEAQ